MKSRSVAGEAAHATAPMTGGKPSVEVIAPKPGGMDRVCSQPGTLEAIKSIDLYAKVAGYLEEQSVDIGSEVKSGQLLARIAVPEHVAQVKKDEEDVKRATARRNQATAAIVAAEADERAAHAAVQLALAEQRSKASYRAYRAKQRDRLRDLLAEKAIDAKLVDEQEDQYEAAASAELAAGEAVTAAKQKEAAAAAKVAQAKADEATANAEIAVANAVLDRSKLLVKYSEIRAPFDGVVTYRKYSPGAPGNFGAYIRPADTGGERTPMLTVEQTDVMRMVVFVPDRDVTYVNPGDAATIQIDADAARDLKFESPDGGKPVVTLSSKAQDPHTRMMKTEIHLRNPDGRLYSGMFGRVTIVLQPGSPTAVRIPPAALAEKGSNKASVRVIRDGKVRTVPVVLGMDNGVEVEVLTGLTPDDRVVLRSSVPVEDGTEVSTTTAESKSSGGH